MRPTHSRRDWKRGSNRFWEKHLTIPGKLNVYGVGLIGSPGVSIGFNKDIGWTHTVSAGKRFTVYSLELAEARPGGIPVRQRSARDEPAGGDGGGEAGERDGGEPAASGLGKL